MAEWIRYSGHEWPVDEDARVDVKLANGDVTKNIAKFLNWRLSGNDKITHYRLSSEEREPITDVGNHYRYEYKGVKLDPYRVCKVYGLNGGPREGIVTKTLTGLPKGHTELELIAELRSCLDRWEEMIIEDAETK